MLVLVQLVLLELTFKQLFIVLMIFYLNTGLKESHSERCTSYIDRESDRNDKQIQTVKQTIHLV